MSGRIVECPYLESSATSQNARGNTGQLVGKRNCKNVVGQFAGCMGVACLSDEHGRGARLKLVSDRVRSPAQESAGPASAVEAETLSTPKLTKASPIELDALDRGMG